MSGTTGPGAGRDSAGAPATRQPGPPAIEATIARLLTLGTRLAIGLLALGSLLLVAAGISPLAEDWPPLDPASLAADLLALRPEGFLWLGLIAVIATPLLRVGVWTVGFGRAGERRMAILGLAVLVVIAFAVIAGTTEG